MRLVFLNKKSIVHLILWNILISKDQNIHSSFFIFKIHLKKSVSFKSKRDSYYYDPNQ